MSSEIEKETAPEGRELVDATVSVLYARKAEEVMLLDLRGLSDVADYFIVATCDSAALMQSVATGLVRDLRGLGIRPIGQELREGSRWAVIDYGEIMVHLFEASERERLDLERLWADAKVESIAPEDFVLIEKPDEADDGFL